MILNYHPLEISWIDNSRMTNKIFMTKWTFQHISYSFKSSMWMRLYFTKTKHLFAWSKKQNEFSQTGNPAFLVFISSSNKNGSKLRISGLPMLLLTLAPSPSGCSTLSRIIVECRGICWSRVRWLKRKIWIYENTLIISIITKTGLDFSSPEEQSNSPHTIWIINNKIPK